MNIFSTIYILMLSMLIHFNSISQTESVTNAQVVNWLDIETAIDTQHVEQTKKIYFIDVYTEWCGWCKRMDATTFKDSLIVSFLNTHFLLVKLDAEQKSTITIKGKAFKFVNNGSRGYHEAAAAILQGKMSYPSFAVLDENLQIITIIQGYQKVDDLAMMLTYFANRVYLHSTFDDFKLQYQKNK